MNQQENSMKNMLLTLLVSVVIFIFAFYLETNIEKSYPSLPNAGVISKKSPPCVQMFYSIEKYAAEYKIPKNYAYGIAFKETCYRGPFDWGYNHKQTSSAGALGPMQVMYSTAKGIFPDKKFSENYLKTNIDFNVKCSMKLLRILYDKHGDWKQVFGAYNTGKPLINKYAIDVFNFKRS